MIAGFAARHAWIERKIAALTSAPTRLVSKENAALPPKGGRRRVVLIGDSSIARWPMERLSERWQFVNRGVGGETVGQVAQRFDADALSLDPDVIVLSAGGNDLIAADFLDPAARRAVIDRTHETLKDLSRRAAERAIPILIATLAPPSDQTFSDCRSGGNRFRIQSLKLNPAGSSIRLADGHGYCRLLRRGQRRRSTHLGQVPRRYVASKSVGLRQVGERALSGARQLRKPSAGAERRARPRTMPGRITGWVSFKSAPIARSRASPNVSGRWRSIQTWRELTD